MEKVKKNNSQIFITQSFVCSFIYLCIHSFFYWLFFYRFIHSLILICVFWILPWCSLEKCSHIIIGNSTSIIWFLGTILVSSEEGETEGKFVVFVSILFSAWNCCFYFWIEISYRSLFNIEFVVCFLCTRLFFFFPE